MGHLIVTNGSVTIGPTGSFNVGTWSNVNFAEINGTNCEIIKIRFNNETSQAIISYKIPFDYDKNLIHFLLPSHQYLPL